MKNNKTIKFKVYPVTQVPFDQSQKYGLISFYDPILEPKIEERPLLPKINVKSKNLVGWLRFAIDDIDKPTKIDIPFSLPDAYRIIESVDRWIENGAKLICVNCIMGQSRSAGCAAALEVIYNGPHHDQWIFDTKRPNMLIYRTLLNAKMNKETL